MNGDFLLYGFTLTIKDRAQASDVIKRAFLKEESVGFQLEFTPFGKTRNRKLQIKLEVDTRPPSGSFFDTKYLDFPINYDLVSQDLPSLFASKCHALLCREYVKGRDWYDFTWYVARRVRVNYTFLSSALDQAGPWQHQGLKVEAPWLAEKLREKIVSIVWDDARSDVERFLSKRARLSLRVWHKEFFLDRVQALSSYDSP